MAAYDSLIAGEPNLVNWWQCGGSLVDAKSGNNGRVIGGSVTYGATGLPGSSNTAISCSATKLFATNNISSPGPQGPFAIECWFKTTSAYGLMSFTDNGSASDRLLYVGTDGKLYFGIWVGSAETLNSMATVTDNNWHHAVGTVSSVNNLALYLDGALVSSNSLTSPPESVTAWWTFAYASHGGAGFWPNFGTETFNGTFAHAAYYSGTILGATDVLQHYQTGLGLTSFMSSVRDPQLTRPPGIN